jgi:hypothetical protein
VNTSSANNVNNNYRHEIDDQIYGEKEIDAERVRAGIIDLKNC